MQGHSKRRNQARPLDADLVDDGTSENRAEESPPPPRLVMASDMAGPTRDSLLYDQSVACEQNADTHIPNKIIWNRTLR
jgi:hypothetical protein